MMAVMDTFWADSIEFTVPRTLLSAQIHPYLDDQVKAVAAAIGIELIDYEHVLFHPVPGSEPDALVKVVLRSETWVRNYLGRRDGQRQP